MNGNLSVHPFSINRFAMSDLIRREIYRISFFVQRYDLRRRCEIVVFMFGVENQRLPDFDFRKAVITEAVRIRQTRRAAAVGHYNVRAKDSAPARRRDPSADADRRRRRRVGAQLKIIDSDRSARSWQKSFRPGCIERRA